MFLYEVAKIISKLTFFSNKLYIFQIYYYYCLEIH